MIKITFCRIFTCFMCLCFIIALISMFAAFSFSGLMKSKYDNLQVIDCYIDRIEYPTFTPNINNYTNWVKCNCGGCSNRLCSCPNEGDSFKPCIKLFTNYNGNTKMIYDDYGKREGCFSGTFNSFMTFIPLEYTPEQSCTFDYDCSCSQYSSEFDLRKSSDIYDNYINTTQKCYSNGNNLYFEKTLHQEMYAGGIITGVVLLLCLFVLVPICYQFITIVLKENQIIKEQKTSNTSDINKTDINKTDNFKINKIEYDSINGEIEYIKKFDDSVSEFSI